MQEVYNAYHTTTEASPVEQVATSQQVDASMASNDRLLGLLLGLFGIIALIAALYAIANVTASRVLVQRRDIAMLGALGFTPGQVVRALLVEQTALGVAASAVGLIGAWAAIRSPAFIGNPNGIPVALTPLPALWMALAAAVTVATVAVATVVPAWRQAGYRRSPPSPPARPAAGCRDWPGSACWSGCRSRSSSAPATPSPAGSRPRSRSSGWRSPWP